MSWRQVDSTKEIDANINQSKPTSAFIDLQTKGNIENHIYGGKSAITYFMRETTRCTWFTQIPIKLKLDIAEPDFNGEFMATISRSGDYLLNAWLRVTLNKLSVYNPKDGWIDSNGSGSETITWCPNFMHNLIRKCSFTSNDLTVDEIFSEHLDFYAAFMIPNSHRIGYNRMIGNFTSPNNGMAGINVCGTAVATFPYVNTNQELFLPLPFFFSKDNSLALPTAALPYADMKFKFQLRNWDELLSSIDSKGIARKVDIRQLKNEIPKLSNIQVWANYAIVSKEERKMMSCTPKDMLIERTQQLGGLHGSGRLNTEFWTSTTNIDLKFDGAIKTLLFGARNEMNEGRTTFKSNYTTSMPSADALSVVEVNASNLNSHLVNASGTTTGPGTYNLNWYNMATNDYSGLFWKNASNVQANDPIGTSCILYENSVRMHMESKYYSLLQPYFHANNVPDTGSQSGGMYIRDPSEVSGQACLSSGYHMYSYALHCNNLDPCGSTNYNKLQNSTLVLTPSKTAVNSSSNGFGPWNIFISAVTYNTLRISGGSLGFPLM